MVGLRHSEIGMGTVALAVRDLDRSLDFYRRAIGLDVLATGDASASLGVDARELLRLEERPDSNRDDETSPCSEIAGAVKLIGLSSLP